MIETQRKRIPWMWVFLISIPSFTNNYVGACGGGAMTFTMKKFIFDPALITFLGSINILFNFMVAPYIAWKSDRVWTRFGRRKPFVLAGWIGLIVSLVAMPLAPNIWALAGIIILFEFFHDFAFTGPFEPLYYEIVPLPQRGRSAAIRQAFNLLAGLYFNFLMIGHFDEIHGLRLDLGFLGQVQRTITGEQLIYWGGAAMTLVMILYVALGVKEAPVHSSLVGDRFSIRRFIGGMFGERQWQLIYILIFAQIAMNQGLAKLGPLLMTEQFGYSKQTMGELHGITAVLKIFIVIPAAGYIADKVDRLKMFQAGLLLSTCHPLIYWFFVKFIALNQVPSPQAIIGFDVFGSFVDLMGNIALGPLLFDYVPRDKMGTVYAGMTFARGMVKLLVMNGVGIWVSVYSRLFMPEGQFDYMSGFMYIFLIGLLGLAASMYFSHERKKGKVIEYGRLDLDGGKSES